jgi:hypothetical protein
VPEAQWFHPWSSSKWFFSFLDKAKIVMKTLVDNDVYRPTAMGFINILEHLSVVILQDSAEMLIAGCIHNLFLHLLFLCELFK